MEVYEHLFERPVEALAVGVHLWASWIAEIVRYPVLFQCLLEVFEKLTTVV